MNVDPQRVFALLGEKVVENALLRDELEAMRKTIALVSKARTNEQQPNAQTGTQSAGVGEWRDGYEPPLNIK